MDIKIFVSHRIDFDAEVIKNDIFIPVYCGAMYKRNDWNKEIIGDNTGDNISGRRNSFCEFTVQYWAWKNIDADYYGLCHYRRYFSFSDSKFDTDNYANVIDTYITSSKQEKYKLNDKQIIENLIKNYDVIVTEAFDVKKAGHNNLIKQYSSNYYLNEEDLDVALNVIRELSPEYYQAAVKTLHSKYFIPCNMFIMNRKYFNQYCEWLYKILFEIEKRIDLSTANENRKRAIGHIAERLLTVFINYISKNVKIKYLQRVVFFRSEKQLNVTPINNSVPVVLSSSNYYVPYLYVTIFSMLKNSSNSKIFDVVILNVDISEDNKNKIKTLSKIFANVNIRFFDIGRLIENYTFIANNHISVETFYRLFIPEIFRKYKNVIFLDSDLIVKNDISVLLEICNNSYVINAAHDADFESQYYSNRKIKKYTEEVLQIDNVENYFQAGVFVFNIESFNSKYKLKDLLDYASSREFIYLDQDILNAFFKNDIKYIDLSWNVMSDCAGIRKNNIHLFASFKTYLNYMKAREQPKIIHFAGFAKPWDRPEDDFAMDFWNVAKETIFYEIILSRMMDFRSWNIVKYNENSKSINWINKIIVKLIPKDQERKFLLKNKLNNFISIFAPPGSKKRQKLKKLYFKLRGWPINF